jgi:replicative DNA helicase
MSVIQNQLDTFGNDFQIDLFHEIIVDPRFGETVIDSLDETHFKVLAFQKILFLIKKYYKDHETIITFPNLKTEVNVEIPDHTFKTQILDTLNEIENKNVTNKNVQNYVKKFCKMQALKNVLKEVSKKIERGDVEEYDQIEKKIKDALIFKETEDSITLFQDMDNVLSDDFRDPIASGIKGIDDIMGGGIAKGELALAIAPLGVGKTTLLTKIANQAYQDGRNVLQIFFEDKEKAIQRKHYTILTEVPLSEISTDVGRALSKSRLESFKKTFENKPDNKKNNLFLQKLPADGVTITKIKNIIKKLNSKGHKIDLLVLDYIDCVSLEKEYANSSSDEWASEGRVMRLLETMIEEVGVACWTATQGNRASTSLEVVKTENMGGSLKKAQIAHFIMSIGKTLEQKEANVATISILKNRLGKDGMIYPNCKFDNGLLIIDTNDQISEKGFEVQKTQDKLARQRILYREHLDNQNQADA